MGQIVLVRHGQTDHNNQGIMQGLLDVPLNEQGEQQARAVGAWLKDRYQLDRVYTSDLARAKQTAECIAREQNCPLLLERPLQEIDVGSWQGKTYQKAQQSDPAVWQQLQKDAMNVRRPGGESFADVYRRVTHWWSQTIEPLADVSCCVVTHSIPVRAILAYALSVDPADFGLRLTVDNTGVSTLEYDRHRERWIVHTINMTCHLGR